ncbi:hypothetical protein GUJ93_ZPchr0010g8890 [Zizania palustris]|uniref:Uncharacterized protein n=1 Tax=Zizania palustris TaxID=103762 RepID=A0A8J5SZE1_ZIZPA|nr:hypothetical protein GUJ93_ZPchr0010g8890 [Zizania palustris]
MEITVDMGGGMEVMLGGRDDHCTAELVPAWTKDNWSSRAVKFSMVFYAEMIKMRLCQFQLGGLTPIDVFAVEWIQSGIIHFGTTVSYFGFVSDVLELSEKYQKRFGPLHYFVAGFLKYLCLPKYSFELEYLPISDVGGSGHKIVEGQEKVDTSYLYDDVLRRSRVECLSRTCLKFA